MTSAFGWKTGVPAALFRMNNCGMVDLWPIHRAERSHCPASWESIAPRCVGGDLVRVFPCDLNQRFGVAKKPCGCPRALPRIVTQSSCHASASPKMAVTIESIAMKLSTM